MALISIVCETTLKSGIMVIGATSIGSMAMGFWESPDTLADMVVLALSRDLDA